MTQEAPAGSGPLPIERILARLLRLGSILSALLLSLGILSLALQGPHARSLIMAGLVTLLLTPVMRVVVAALVFARQRDWLFVLFCLVVLASLAAGARLGLAV